MAAFKWIIFGSISYCTYRYVDLSLLGNRTVLALVVSIYISRRGYQKKSLSFSGALSAVFVGFLAVVSNLSSFLCLLMFFVTSSVFTKWRSDTKRLIEENFKEGGERNMKFCNGGILVIISALFISEVGYGERVINFSRDFTAAVLLTGMIGTIACCNGDTWSSEIGTVAGLLQPRLITTFKKVPVGTNGGVTPVGLLASAIGGFVIGFAFLISLLLFVDDSASDIWRTQWLVLPLSVFSGTVGSIVDSYLGALFQYSGFCPLRRKVVARKYSTVEDICGRNVLDNDQVNFISSLIMAILTPIFGYYSWQYV